MEQLKEVLGELLEVLEGTIIPISKGEKIQQLVSRAVKVAEDVMDYEAVQELKELYNHALDITDKLVQIGRLMDKMVTEVDKWMENYGVSLEPEAPAGESGLEAGEKGVVEPEEDEKFISPEDEEWVLPSEEELSSEEVVVKVRRKLKRLCEKWERQPKFKKGALKKQLGVPEGEQIEDYYSVSDIVNMYKKGSELLKKRIRMAVNMAKKSEFWQKVGRAIGMDV